MASSRNSFRFVPADSAGPVATHAAFPETVRLGVIVHPTGKSGPGRIPVIVSSEVSYDSSRSSRITPPASLIVTGMPEPSAGRLTVWSGPRAKSGKETILEPLEFLTNCREKLSPATPSEFPSNRPPAGAFHAAEELFNVKV